MHCHTLRENAGCYTFAEKTFSWAIPNLYARHSQCGVWISRGENLLKGPEKTFLFLWIKEIHKNVVIQYNYGIKMSWGYFPVGPVFKNSPPSIRDMGSIPGP